MDVGPQYKRLITVYYGTYSVKNVFFFRWRTSFKEIAYARYRINRFEFCGISTLRPMEL
jgi:hypothetical protein